jgi:hypothetical protein
VKNENLDLSGISVRNLQSSNLFSIRLRKISFNLQLVASIFFVSRVSPRNGFRNQRSSIAHSLIQFSLFSSVAKTCAKQPWSIPKPSDGIRSLDFRSTLQKVSSYGCVVDQFRSKIYVRNIQNLNYWSWEIYTGTTFLIISLVFTIIS